MAGVPASSHGSSASLPLLNVVQYAPASLATYNVAALALAALDTTNLTISFTVPANGRVLVRATIFCDKAAAVNVIGVGLLNHSGGAQVGVTASGLLGAYTASQCISVAWLLTGLSAGSLQLDLAGGASAAGNSHFYAQGATGAVNGANAGPAVLEAWAA